MIQAPIPCSFYTGSLIQQTIVVAEDATVIYCNLQKSRDSGTGRHGFAKQPSSTVCSSA